MHYVYLIQSGSRPERRYVGRTDDLRTRIKQHNAGASPHTSEYMPWTVIAYLAFSNRHQAEAFEKYLKSGSGHAFAPGRLW